MFSFASHVRYSEVDQYTALTLDKLIDYFQDCCIFHSESLHVGLETLRKQGYAWMLTGWQIEIQQMPHLTDQITVGTWPYDFKGCKGWRNFIMENEDGTRLATANSQWVFISLETGRPAPLTPEYTKAYQVEEPLVMEWAEKNISLPKEYEEGTSFQVRSDHIDTNHHVNNSQYVKMALACMPEEVQPWRMRAEYKRQAKLGDEIFPRISHTENCYVVALCNQAGKPYAVVEIKEK